MIYSNNLYRVTIIAACKPRDSYKLAFFKTKPHRPFVISSLKLAIDELDQSIKCRSKQIDCDTEIELDNLHSELERAKLAKEIVEAAPNYDPGSPVAVMVAGTQVGTIKFETEEVWEVEG